MLFSCAALDLLYTSNVLFSPNKLDSWKTVSWTRITILALSALLYICSRFAMGTPHFQVEDNPIAVIENITFRAINHVFLHSINTWLLICPHWLSFDWSMGCVQVVKTWNDYRLLVLCVYLLVFSAIILNISFLLKSRRRKSQMMSLFALLIIPFLPASGIVHVGFVIAERILYMPSLGWSLIVALGFTKLLHSCNSKVLRLALKVFFALVCLVFILKTRVRAHVWLKDSTLFRSGLLVCPQNAKVHYNIAKTSPPDIARIHYHKAIRMNPDYDAALLNLGNLYRDLGDLDRAEEYLRRALSSIEYT